MIAEVVPSAVAAWAARTPDAVAVRDDAGALTYAELVARADAVARSLVSRGVRPGEVVGVCAGRDTSLVVALLGVMRAGAAYLPLDPAYPSDRLQFLVEDVGVRWVVGSEAAAALRDGPLSGCGVLDIASGGELEDVSGAEALPDVGLHDLAYVIHTSGSTGTPKGVAVEHHSVARLFDRVADHVPVSPSDVWTCFHSASFDFSVWELWGALTSGGQVVIVSHADSRDPEAFTRLVDERAVTVLSVTPSALARLLPRWADGVSLPDNVGHIVLGGEAVRLTELATLLGAPHRPRVWNLYGITETTVHASVYELGPDDVPRAQVSQSGGSPIGVPLDDLTFRVVDQTGVEAPPGAAGELWIAGPGVARGYLNRSELTAERFVVASIGGVEDRWYRTGDLVRLAPERVGGYEYLGRGDRQVQLRGFRIELGEIEAALGSHEGISSAVVEVVDGPDGPELRAFLTITAGMTDTERQLRARLAERLPQHLLPASVVVVDAMPLTANGKLDRARLQEVPMRRLPTTATAGPGVDETGANDDLGRSGSASPTERALTAIVLQVLDVGAVAPDDHFFDVGGDSMSALRLVAVVSREFGVRVGIATLYRHPTVSELAAWLDEARAADA